jgi:hypothetical protein
MMHSCDALCDQGFAFHGSSCAKLESLGVGDLGISKQGLHHEFHPNLLLQFCEPMFDVGLGTYNASLEQICRSWKLGHTKKLVDVHGPRGDSPINRLELFCPMPNEFFPRLQVGKKSSH